MRLPDPAHFFLIVALSCGIPFALLTPPFQSPDEYNHFFRAFQVSEGGFFPEKLNANRLGGTLPQSLDALKTSFLPLKYDYTARTSWAALRHAADIRLAPEQRVFLDFPHIAVYAPTAYLPQSAGLWVGRLFTDRVLMLLYCARLTNLLIWVLLVFFALRRMPFQRWTLAVLALLPASLAIASSCNADVVTNGLAFWLVAWGCKGVNSKISTQVNPSPGPSPEGEGGLLPTISSPVGWGRRNPKLDQAPLPFGGGAGGGVDSGRGLGFTVTGLLALHKLILAPYALLAGLSAFRGKHGWRRALRRALLPLGIALLLAGVWGRLANAWFVPYDRYEPAVRDALTLNPGVDPPAQIRFVLTHPLTFCGMVGKSFVQALPSLGAHFVGKFGWEKNYLPAWCLAALWLALALAIFSEKNPLSGAQRAWLAGTALLIVALWAVTLYAIWRPVGAPVLDTWQGRYFVPVAPLLALAMGFGALRRWTQWTIPAALTIVVIGNVVLGMCLLMRYFIV